MSTLHFHLSNHQGRSEGSLGGVNFRQVLRVFTEFVVRNPKKPRGSNEYRSAPLP